MLHIVIPVHNRINYTLKCLESLSQQTTSAFKIVIVDDGSSDGTSEAISEKYPDVIIVKGGGSLFWTKATNLGIRYALDHGAQLIMTLNNDTIATPDFVQKMLSYHEESPNSILGAFALDAMTKEPIYAGEIINWKRHKYESLLNINKKFEGLGNVSHFPGRGLLIPKNVIEKIGLFDEKNFPHYLADYDYTHQAVKNGFSIYCNYEAKLFIYPEESGNAEIRRKKSLQNYYKHLFDLKGGGNLIYFTRYALKNCPYKYLPSFLLIGYAKRCLGFFIKK
jgi:GT2 family glycosyltransferase